MERDFTKNCYNKFCALLNPLSDKGWRGIPDWLGGHNRFLQPSLSDLLPNWGDILGKTTEMEAYYRDLLDRHHASKEKIRDVFENISALDRSFAGSSSGHFGSCRKQLDAFRQYVNALTQTVFAGTVPPVRFCGLANYFSTASVKLFMEKPLFQLQLRSYMEKLSAAQAPQFTASTFSQLSQQDKQDYVRQCADLCPELAEKLNAIFSDPDWTEQEKLDIKFLIYSAPEPYRTIYMEQLCSYRISLFQQGEEQSTAYVDATKKILIQDDDKRLILNERGPYTSFFHESGHMLDDFAQVEDSLSRSYRFNGQSLYDSIFADVRNYVHDLIDNTYGNLPPEMRNYMLISMNLSDLSSFNFNGDSNPMVDKACTHIKEIMKERLQGEANASAIDIYSGVTNCAIRGDGGHNEPDYWYTKVTDENGVKKNVSRNAQASELWAEFFAAQMIHDEEALASTKQFFPTAYPLLEQMAEDIASK